MRSAFLGAALLAVAATPAAASGERMTVTGEAIDTWCYFSGVMGGPDAVVGSAHHTCALWCAAGGIPVGLLADDGRVFMVLKMGESGVLEDQETLMTIASHRLTVDGVHVERDGVDYLLVSEVVADEGIVNTNHEDYDVVPHFAIPEPKS